MKTVFRVIETTNLTGDNDELRTTALGDFPTYEKAEQSVRRHTDRTTQYTRSMGHFFEYEIRKLFIAQEEEES